MLLAVFKHRLRLPDLGLRPRGMKGRWVRDRDLGGRLVFLPEGESLPSRKKSRSPLNPVGPVEGEKTVDPATKRAAWRAAVDDSSSTEPTPPWWEPEPVEYRTDGQRAAGANRARWVLKERTTTFMLQLWSVTKPHAPPKKKNPGAYCDRWSKTNCKARISRRNHSLPCAKLAWTLVSQSKSKCNPEGIQFSGGEQLVVTSSLLAALRE